MVCSSITYKVRHLVKVFVSYVSVEIKVNSAVSVLLILILATAIIAL